MKKITKTLLVSLISIISLSSLTGCALADMFAPKEVIDPLSLTPDDFEPMYYTSEEKLPEDAYYIVRNYTNVDTYDEKGNLVTDKETGMIVKHDETRYFPLLQAECNYTEKRTEAYGFEPGRIRWVNYNLDEGLMPTMYPGDQLIYKSSTYIPTKYALEKFFDDGYTLGVAGLYQDLSGNYRYVSKKNEGNGAVMSTSNAVGFEALEADSIYLVSVGEDRITPLNMTMSGTVSGLELMKSYDCDIRTGTEKVSADLLCNIHYFSSAETYMFGSFTFITDIIARLNIPDYATTGYYTIGEGGMFRYIATPGVTDYHGLKPADYNDTIYTYNEEGYVNGTTIGLTFDENYFLVYDPEAVIDETRVRRTYDETIEEKNKEKEIVMPNEVEGTKKTATSSGNYIGTYKYESISEPATTGGGYLYTITATCVDEDSDETLSFQYEQTASKEAPVNGKTYKVVFKKLDDTYKIIKATPIDGETEEAPVKEQTEEITETVDEESGNVTE